MTVHLVKLCAGAQSVDDLQDRVNWRVAANKKAKRGAVHDHVTRMKPRRREELLDGGAIYWVIKGNILVRQDIIGLDEVTGDDGISRCAILLHPRLVYTQAQPRRAFQGWRYLKVEESPVDLPKSGPKGPPPELQIELAALGLL